MLAEDAQCARLVQALPDTATNVIAVASTASNHFAERSNSAANLTGSASTNSMDTLDDRYQLAIGDRLSFRMGDKNGCR